MTDDETTWSITIELTPSELALLRTSLRHLFTSEDDPDEIDAIKRLLDRLPCDVLVVKPARFRTGVQRARRGVRYVGAPLPFAF